MTHRGVAESQGRHWRALSAAREEHVGQITSSTRSAAAADRADRGRKALPGHRAPVRARADPPARPRDGRGGRFPQGSSSRQFFDMGLMGIEIPEEYGGQGGSFFQAILAVEELSAVDPSGRRHRGRAEHHLQQRAAALGHARAEGQVPAAAGAEIRWRPTRFPKPAPARTRSPWPPRAEDRGDHFPAQRPQAVDHQRRRSGLVPAVRQCPTRGRLQGHHRVPGGARFPRLPGGQEGGQAGPARFLHLRADSGQLPRAARERAWAKSARDTRSPSRR